MNAVPSVDDRFSPDCNFPVVRGPVHWRADGSIRVQAQHPWLSGATRGAPETPGLLQYGFGLPGQPPDRRWREEDRLPIYEAVWEHDAIRYTQIVLISRIGTGEIMTGDRHADDAVILVQLTGLSLASTYTDATAAIQINASGRPIELSLEGGLLRAKPGAITPIFAVVDVPTEGIERSEGTEIRFRGHMPPGTSGSMTIKIPLGPVRDAEALDRLLDLEFDDEFRRVKRFWKARLAAEATSGSSMLIPEPGP
jgi:hypothetical protein